MFRVFIIAVDLFLFINTAGSFITRRGRQRPRIQAAKLVTVCMKDDMEISLARTYVRYYKPWELALNSQDAYSNKCIGSGNRTHIIFKVGYTECGTKSFVSKRLIYYKNSIRNLPLPPGTVISRKRPVYLNFGCYFDRRFVNTIRLKLREESNVTCTLDSMRMTLPKSIVPRYQSNQLALHDKRCKGQDEGDHFVFVTKYSECGTKLITKENSVLFQNTIRNIPLDQNVIITRKRTISVVFGCYFGKEFQRTLLSNLKPKRKQIADTISNFGAFKIRLEATDKDGNRIEKSNAIQTTVGDNVYIRITGNALANAGITVGAKKCFVSTDPNRHTGLSYTLINNGCGVDSTVKFLSSSKNSQRFSFESFLFITKPSSYLYVYCDIALCSVEDSNSFCASSCQDGKAARRKRSQAMFVHHFVRSDLVFGVRS